MMKKKRVFPRLLLASFLATFSTLINSAPAASNPAIPQLMLDGFDKLFEQPVQLAPTKSSDMDTDSGKAFAKQISTITEQDLQKAAENRSAMATQIASNFPEQNRADMEKVFNIALYVQKRIEQAAGVPEGDIPTATASFLYGAWSAYNEGMEIPDEKLPTLYKQVSKLIASNQSVLSKLNNADPKEHQNLYEYLSMTGNWMGMFADTFKKNPDQNTVNNIKSMVKELLYSAFKIDANRLHITQEGNLTLL